MSLNQPARIAIYHNILWAKYKGGLFSQVYALAPSRDMEVSFTQMAETEGQRLLLSSVDLSYHSYPYRLLFHGSYDYVPWYRRAYAAARDLLRFPSDVVILAGYHYFEAWVMLLLCILLRRKRAVFSDSTAFDRPEVKWREIAKRVFFANCDGCFPCGERSKHYLKGYGVAEEKLFIRHQVAALPHEYDAGDVLKRYEGLAPDSYDVPRFLFIGRLAEEKGLLDLILAFRAVRGRLANARLDLVGAGPFKDRLALSVAELGLEDSVTFLGSKNLEEFLPLFVRSVAMVLPSLSEPWGLVVNESLSYGCPVVVSEQCGCVPELVIRGVTGYSFNAGDVEALTEAMVEAAAMSEDRPATARRCLQVIADFTPERAATQILDGCERILRLH